MEVPMEVGMRYPVRNSYPVDTRVIGLLVAACVNRAPEGLIGAAVAEVGVLDLLKASSVNVAIRTLTYSS